jgi:hypothetical protein
MCRDSLDEPTCAGEPHRCNLVPADTVFKRAAVAEEELLAARGMRLRVQTRRRLASNPQRLKLLVVSPRPSIGPGR